MGCEVPRFRSIPPNFPDGFCTLLISMHLPQISTVLQGWLVSWYPLSPLFVEEA